MTSTLSFKTNMKPLTDYQIALMVAILALMLNGCMGKYVTMEEYNDTLRMMTSSSMNNLKSHIELYDKIEQLEEKVEKLESRDNVQIIVSTGTISYDHDYIFKNRKLPSVTTEYTEPY